MGPSFPDRTPPPTILHPPPTFVRTATSPPLAHPRSSRHMFKLLTSFLFSSPSNSLQTAYELSTLTTHIHTAQHLYTL